MKAPFQYIILTENDADIFDRIDHDTARVYFEGTCADSAVTKQCVEARARSHNGDWQHNVDLAVQGLSSDDADEVYYARYHHREAEFI